jgi:hypothetical protein
MLFGVDEECPNHLNIQSLIDIPEQRYYSNLDNYDDPESPHLGPGWELRCSSISAPATSETGLSHRRPWIPTQPKFRHSYHDLK